MIRKAMTRLRDFLKTRLLLIRFRRLLASLSEPIFPLLTLFAGVVALIVDREHEITNPTLLYVLVAIALIVWLAQSFFAYRRRTHEPQLVLRFQDTWESDQGHTLRKRAGKAMQKLKGQLADIDSHERALSDIDEALDVLEDVGFYMFGDQISPEAAHHHFFYWISGYWHCARDYIDAIRKADPTRWENLGQLYETTLAIERGLTGRSYESLAPNSAEMGKFREEEAHAGEALSGESEKGPQPESRVMP